MKWHDFRKNMDLYQDSFKNPTFTPNTRPSNHDFAPDTERKCGTDGVLDKRRISAKLAHVRRVITVETVERVTLANYLAQNGARHVEKILGPFVHGRAFQVVFHAIAEFGQNFRVVDQVDQAVLEPAGHVDVFDLKRQTTLDE